ncbi:MAG: OmpA family protein [Acidobacteriota bacterium]
MNRSRLQQALALLGLLFLLLLWGADRSARGLARRETARRLAAEALAHQEEPELQRRLFHQAREADPSYDIAPCEQAAQLDRQGHAAEASESFRSCLERDPRQIYAQLGYARNRLKSAGSESYVEARSYLTRFLDAAPRDPVASRDAASRKAAADLVFDLEDLLSGESPGREGEILTRGEILGILLRSPIRSVSRYDGPRVPLRLGFRPGDTALGTLAEEQLQQVVLALRDGSLAGSRIGIEGHTDSVEGRTRGARLGISIRRAQAVKDFLVRHGAVPERRVAVSGFADDYPLAPNDTDQGRAANRRVEIVNLATRDLVRSDVRDPLGF